MTFRQRSPNCAIKASKWHGTLLIRAGGSWPRSGCLMAPNSRSMNPGTRHRYSPEPMVRRIRGSDLRLTHDLLGGVTAAAWAEEQSAAVRDDPSARIALVERCYHGPFGKAPQHLPYRRAAMSFMRWQLRRGVLEPAHADRPGSPWWRGVHERLVRDGCEAVGLSGDLGGPPSSST